MILILKPWFYAKNQGFITFLFCCLMTHNQQPLVNCIRLPGCSWWTQAFPKSWGWGFCIVLNGWSPKWRSFAQQQHWKLPCQRAWWQSSGAQVIHTHLPTSTPVGPLKLSARPCSKKLLILLLGCNDEKLGVLHLQKLMLGVIGGCHIVFRGFKQSVLQIVTQ